MAAFAVCGLSLGFQLPNLTLQMQAAVGRADQGAASALIQTLRTLGSMFGASLAGMVVSLGFARGLAPLLAQAQLQDPRVAQLLASPQLLVRSADQDLLAKLGEQLGFNAHGLIEQARLGLVKGIHEAFLVCLLLAVVSYFVSRRLPPFTREHPPIAPGEAAPPGD